jgi:hypothetical protein
VLDLWRIRAKKENGAGEWSAVWMQGSQRGLYITEGYHFKILFSLYTAWQTKHPGPWTSGDLYFSTTLISKYFCCLNSNLHLKASSTIQITCKKSSYGAIFQKDSVVRPLCKALWFYQHSLYFNSKYPFLWLSTHIIHSTHICTFL